MKLIGAETSTPEKLDGYPFCVLAWFGYRCVLTDECMVSIALLHFYFVPMCYVSFLE